MEKWPETIGEARDLAEEKPYVASELPQLPRLTGDLLIDAIQQAGFSGKIIENLCKQMEIRQEEVCEQLVIVACNIGGGLSPSSKRVWIEQRLEEGMSFSEMLSL